MLLFLLNEINNHEKKKLIHIRYTFTLFINTKTFKLYVILEMYAIFMHQQNEWNF